MMVNKLTALVVICLSASLCVGGVYWAASGLPDPTRTSLSQTENASFADNASPSPSSPETGDSFQEGSGAERTLPSDANQEPAIPQDYMDTGDVSPLPMPTPSADVETGTRLPTDLPTRDTPQPGVVEPSLPLISPEQIKDFVMNYIKTEHPETAKLMNDLEWTGGQITSLDQEIYIYQEDSAYIIDNDLPCSPELYVYQSDGWTVSVLLPTPQESSYNVTVNYNVPSSVISIPYAVHWEGTVTGVWEGTWQNIIIEETDYVFAQ